jgi:hypothetical protein
VGEEAQLDDATTSAMQEQAALLAEKLELKQAEVNANHLIVEDETALV